MINKLDKITFFSYNRKDGIALLSFYNGVFFISCILIKNDFEACFLIAFLLSLIFLFIITAIDIFEKEHEEDLKSHEEETQIRKTIENEYQRIYKLKRKHELLMKTESREENLKEKNIISDVDNPHSSSINTNHDQKVHFTYLNKFGPPIQNQDFSESQP